MELPDLKKLKDKRMIVEHEKDEADSRFWEKQAQEKEKEYKAVAEQILNATPKLISWAHNERHSNRVVIGKFMPDDHAESYGYPKNFSMPKEQEHIFLHIKKEIEKDPTNKDYVVVAQRNVGVRMPGARNPIGTDEAKRYGAYIIVDWSKSPHR